MNKQTSTSRRRPKGSGSITQKANGTYLGRISISGYEPYSCTGKTRKDVEKKLEAFRIRILKEEIIPQKIFVNRYIEDWLTTVKQPTLKAASYDRLERTFENHIKNSPVGRCQLGNITTLDIQKLINEKSTSLSYSSLKKIYELLNSCFCHAVAIRDMAYNPVKAVQMPKQENLAKKTKSIQIFTNEELKRIEETAYLNYNTGEPRFKHAYLFILLANTGLRAGEALALTWDNVDMDKRLIYVRQNSSRIKNRESQSEKRYKTIITTVKTKNGNRCIPCNPKAYESLCWFKEYQNSHNIQSNFVDCDNSGNILKQENLPKILKPILIAANVPYKNTHSFRHTFASNLIQAGVDIKVVSQLLGHNSVKITYDTYVHTNLNNAIDAVNQLNY